MEENNKAIVVSHEYVEAKKLTETGTLQGQYRKLWQCRKKNSESASQKHQSESG